MKAEKIVLVLLAALFTACQESSNEKQIITGEPEIEAMAQIYGISVSDVQDPNSSYTHYDVNDNRIGTAYFYQIGNVVTLELTLSAQAANGAQAVHIHEGTLGKPLRHWNQRSAYSACNTKSLGEVWAKPFAGDVGNIPVDENGNGKLIIQTDLWALNTGDEKDILNKIVIVHQDYQNFLDECSDNFNHSHDDTNPKIGGGEILLTSDVPQVQSIVPRLNHLDSIKICN